MPTAMSICFIDWFTNTKANIHKVNSNSNSTHTPIRSVEPPRASDVQVWIWYSRSPLPLDFVEETPVTLQVDFRHVKTAVDPRKRIILGHNWLNKQYK